MDGVESEGGDDELSPGHQNDDNQEALEAQEESNNKKGGWITIPFIIGLF